MNYYYDIILNFQEDNLQFYEMDKNDYYEKIKKIPIIQINTNHFKKIANHKIKIKEELLEKIYKQTQTSNKVIDYALLIADKNNVLAIEFNNFGEEINRSIVSIEDEINILELIYTIKLDDFPFEIISSFNNRNDLRQEKYIKDFIKLEIKYLYENLMISKLQYLYLEWFGILEENYNKIYQDMINKLDEEITLQEERIFKIIKLSYSEV